MLNDELKIVHRSSFRVHRLISSVGQHRLDALLIAFGNDCVNIQLALTFVRLLGQNVAGVAVAALNLSRRGKAKTLGRALMCF